MIMKEPIFVNVHGGRKIQFNPNFPNFTPLLLFVPSAALMFPLPPYFALRYFSFSPRLLTAPDQGCDHRWNKEEIVHPNNHLADGSLDLRVFGDRVGATLNR